MCARATGVPSRGCRCTSYVSRETTTPAHSVRKGGARSTRGSCSASSAAGDRGKGRGVSLRPGDRGFPDDLCETPGHPARVSGPSGTCPRAIRDVSPGHPGRVPGPSGTCPRTGEGVARTRGIVSAPPASLKAHPGATLRALGSRARGAPDATGRGPARRAAPPAATRASCSSSTTTGRGAAPAPRERPAPRARPGKRIKAPARRTHATGCNP